MQEPTERPPTRAVLMDAALAVFTEQTYGGAAVAEVAKRAGMSVGTLYRYFPSKEALGNAVFQRWKGMLVERIAGSGDEPARVMFARMWRLVLDFADEAPDAFAFLEFQQHEGYLDAESVALSERVSAAGEEFVARGQRTGEIRAGDPAMLLALVYGALVGLIKARRGGLKLGAAELEASERAAWALLAAEN
ncbi:MAG TPA: TetR/AcrR family transcriptional regulator [Actinophytocola sp.]|uniref:TetR/AcrR family transcriptional regulator n=1 Tax=Actinophytocola sp. TaxID=1872138 RepID=UPI002DF85C27|nr:TetR/AcrR family transcriptional regulator [Actinophytocola sp.]